MILGGTRPPGALPGRNPGRSRARAPPGRPGAHAPRTSDHQQFQPCRPAVTHSHSQQGEA